MLVALGFCVAGLITLLVAPLYRRRAARLATDALRRSMPLTEAEIRADKDRLRAEYAIAIHKLEARVEESSLAAARQMVEINRRDATISALEGEVGKLRTFLDEYENARRVLEQTITERLPRVEHRLAEAKKLLFQRDREIAELTRSSGKQSQALEEATQINTQQRDEIHRLNATLATRAARNREGFGDPRFDGEIALRAEIEALRTKTRDQSQLISRLQGVLVQSGVRSDDIAGLAGDAGLPAATKGRLDPAADVQRLRKDLADAQQALRAARGVAEAGQAGQTGLESELRALKAATQDQAAEIARLKALLRTYEEEDGDDRAIKDSKIAMKARLSALQAQSDENAQTIQSLRAEIAAANDKLARQAAHFMDEMRRLGAGTIPASGPARRSSYDVQRRPLSERISAPRPDRTGGRPAGASRSESALAAKAADSDPRISGFLRALDGAAAAAPPATAASEPGPAEPGSKGAAEAAGSNGSTSATAATGRPGKRPSLLERITRAEKPVA